jgi:phosphoglycolate phosphatase-like HAD superfamily hydrolase
MDSLPDIVIFDLDGTLADSQEGILTSFRSTLDELGLHPSDERLRSLIGPPLEDSFSQLGIDETDLQRVVARYRHFYAVTGVRQCRLYDGVASVLQHFSRAGVRMAVATSKRVDFANEMLEVLGVRHHFDAVSGASIDGTLTLKIDIVAEVLSCLGAPNVRRTWMVGDREYDVHAARFHGLVPIGVLWGYGTREELVVSGAEFILNEPIQLSELEEQLEGGDPVCWAHLSCPTCGVVLGGDHRSDQCEIRAN